MITASNKEELKNALAKLDIPKIVKRTIYNNITLGRTYSPTNESNTTTIPGAGELVIAGDLLRTYKAAGMERSRHTAHRDAIVRSATENIKRNRERYRVVLPRYAEVVCRNTDVIDGTVVAIDRATASELVAHSTCDQRSVARRTAEKRDMETQGRNETIHNAVHDTSGDSSTTPSSDERRRDQEYATGATYLVAKAKGLDRAKVA